MKNIKSILKFKKIIIIWILIITLGLVAYSLLVSNKNFTLTINTNEEDSLIEISEIGRYKGKYSNKLKGGVYTIRIQLKDYETINETIILNRDLIKDYQLKPVVINENLIRDTTQRVKDVNLQNSNNIKVTAEGQLIGLNNNGGVNVSGRNIYSEIVSNYSISEDKLVLIKRDNTKEIDILDLKTETLNTIDAGDYEHIVAATTNNDFIYFIGDYNSVSRTASLYRSKIDNFSPEIIANTAALNIEVLEGRRILTYAPADAEDQGELSLISEDSKSTILSLVSNGYSVSPNKNLFINYTSKGTYLVDNTNKQRLLQNINPKTEISWLNNETLLLVRNIDKDTIGVQSLSIENLQLGEEYFINTNSNSNVVDVIGVNNNILYTMSLDGNIHKTDLSNIKINP